MSYLQLAGQVVSSKHLSIHLLPSFGFKIDISPLDALGKERDSKNEESP